MGGNETPEQTSTPPRDSPKKDIDIRTPESYSAAAMDGMPLLTLRRRAGLTQFQLAVRAGLSEKSIVRIERGQANPTAETLQKLASALGVAPAALLGSEQAVA